MKKTKVTDKGFYGCYWSAANSPCAIIGMFGDDVEDFMAKAAVKWLQRKFNINVLTMSPDKKDYGHHSLPLERFGAAIEYLQSQGNEKFAIVGASTTGMLALLAASYYPQISLTIALTPPDFVMEGFYQGNRDGRKEWPGEGESSVTWQGEPLPYLPYAYRHPDYWDKVQEQSAAGGDKIASSQLFIDSERAHPLQEEELIKVERIRGKLVLIGAEDDVLWETAKYIRRMETRLAAREHSCKVESHIYEHGTHFVFPEGMLQTMLPLGADLLTRIFADGRKYPRECRETRIDIERHVTKALCDWKLGRIS